MSFFKKYFLQKKEPVLNEQEKQTLDKRFREIENIIFSKTH